jgi:peptide/nickel transport system substrate-binding protein
VLHSGGAAVAGLAGAALIGCDGDEDAPAIATGTAQRLGSTPAAAQTQVRDTATPRSLALRRGGTLSVPLGLDPPTIYPYGHTSFLTKGIASHVYNRLLKRVTFAGSDGAETFPGPDAAISAESADGQTWTVTLREGLRLHDVPPVHGRALDADDVMFSAALLRADSNPNRDAVANWLNVEAPDPVTVVFTLDAPSPTFTEQIADANLLQILPREADGGFDPATTMIGGGPWILREYRVSSGFSFDRNPGYYELGEDGEPLPYTDQLSRPIINEYSNRLAQFLAGNLHLLAVGANDVIPLRNEVPALQWLGQVRAVQSMLYWDHILETDQPWGDARFRRGVSMALDRDALTDVAYNTIALRDAGLPTNLAWNNIIPCGFGPAWWLDPQTPEHGASGDYFRYDPTEGRRMLEAAGVEDAFEIPYLYGNHIAGSFGVMAEAQIAMLRDIGLNPKTDVQDYASLYSQTTLRGDFEGMAFDAETAFTEAGDYWGRLFGDTELNHSRVVVPRMTEIDDRQRIELDEAARSELFHEGQILNAESMYYVPSQFGVGTSYTAFQPSVQGGIRDTWGFAAATEEYAYYWLDE